MGEDNHKEEDKDLEEREEPKHIAFCEEHKQKVLKEIMHTSTRRVYLSCAGNLFTTYMKGGGFNLASDIFAAMEEKQDHYCPMCYWEELEIATYYFLETVLGIHVDKNIVDGHEGRIITDVH